MSVFHCGERLAQRMAGVSPAAVSWAPGALRQSMTEQLQLFFAQIPFVVISARDARHRPWASVLASARGQVASVPNATTLRLLATPDAADALHTALNVDNQHVGVLGMMLENRRRNRVNGRVIAPAAASSTTRDIAVDLAFGNCPQYIWLRKWKPLPAASTTDDDNERSRTTKLDAHLVFEHDDRRITDRVTGADASRDGDRSALATIRSIITSATSFFIATGVSRDRTASVAASEHTEEQREEAGRLPVRDGIIGMDVSHRGGAPGFVELSGDAHTLTIPDYSGNNMFNSIGNLLLDPLIGVTFVDFATGGILQITGRAEIIWAGPEVARHSGAKRLIRVTLDEARLRLRALPIVWDSLEASIPLAIESATFESEDSVSFVLADADGRCAVLPPFKAGQHLPIEIAIDGQTVQRSYSISSTPADRHHYRLTIKRHEHGLVSRFLHDQVLRARRSVAISASLPSGTFGLPAPELASHVVLIAGGTGITPFTAMAHEWLDDQSPAAAAQTLTILHSVQSRRLHPLANELHELAHRAKQAGRQMRLHWAYTRDASHNVDLESAASTLTISHGRIDATLLQSLVKVDGVRVLLCGPYGFVDTMQSLLVDSLKVASANIEVEQF